jgi:hypothetical protein
MAVISIVSLLVIIDDLNIRWSQRSVEPFEANSPLIVNANTVLALAISSERFKTITGQRGKIAQRSRRLKPIKFQARRAFKPRKSLDSVPVSEAFSVPAAIADDHDVRISQKDALRHE